MLSHRLSHYLLGAVAVGALLCCVACTDEHREDLQFSDAPPENNVTAPDAQRHASRFSSAPSSAQPVIVQPYTMPSGSDSR